MELSEGVEKKLYQLIIGRLDGERVTEGDYLKSSFDLVRRGIGGFIIFGGKREEIRGFVEAARSLAETPLFIASDIERGVGQQITGTTHFPPQMAVASSINRDSPTDIDLLHRMVTAIADEAIDSGINMPLIPVMDINRNPDNPIICTRAFSDDPEIVAWFGRKYVEILENRGLISCAKHFPGHGDTSVDSHISLPVIDRPLNELMDREIHPFGEAVRAGVSSIMVGHLSIPSIDPYPASISEKLVTGILRNQLSFDGLILTDALNMSALSGIENIHARCINSGVDILLHPANVYECVGELKSALESGDVDEARIDEALKRISIFKNKIEGVGAADVRYEDHEKLSGKITGKSITLVKGKSGLLPLSDERKIQIILAGESKYYLNSPFRECFRNVSPLTAISVVPPALSTTSEEAGSSDAILIVAIFTDVAAWKGTAGIDGTEIHRISGLIRSAERSIVISFGNPYLLRHFGMADILIAAYEGRVMAQTAVIRCLKGEEDFQGTLPIGLSLHL